MDSIVPLIDHAGDHQYWTTVGLKDRSDAYEVKNGRITWIWVEKNRVHFEVFLNPECVDIRGLQPTTEGYFKTVKMAMDCIIEHY